MIPIYKPYISKYKDSAISAINDEWISNYGIFVKNSEDKIKKLFKIPYCILMNNGTAATHCLLLAVKFKYPNINKLYVPNNVFISVWNCSLMCFNKNQLEVLEIDKMTLNMNINEDYINSLDTNSCVFIVHNLGNIINVPRLKKIREDLIFIEDNCEGLFGKYENIYSGMSKCSLCSSCSFYANKTLTTGEGGAFFTHNTDIYNYIKSVYSHGMTESRYIHDKLATNYRMTNIQAAFLYDQLNDIENILNLKNKIFNNYDLLLDDYIKDGKIIKSINEDNTIKSNWMYYIIIPNKNFKDIELFFNEKMIQIRPLFYDIRKHKHLEDINVNYKELDIINNGIMLPSYPELKFEEQEYIINCLKEYLNI